MNVLVVIPARGGSKGVPRKNMRFAAGRTLLDWSIRAANESRWVFQTCGESRPVVSTDDHEIAWRAQEEGEAVALMRPAELATDEALTDPVLVHALKAVQAERAPIDVVVLLQPTVPVRRHGLVDECIEVMRNTGADSVLTAYPLHFAWWRETPAYPYNTRTGHPAPEAWRSQCQRRPRRQDMEARELMYHEDGSVYVTRADYLLEHGARIGGRIEVVETERTVDIDTERDLLVADAMLRAAALEEWRRA